MTHALRDSALARSPPLDPTLGTLAHAVANTTQHHRRQNGGTRHAFLAGHSEHALILPGTSSPSSPRYRLVRGSRADIGFLSDSRDLVLSAPSRILPAFRWAFTSAVHHLLPCLSLVVHVCLPTPVLIPAHLPRPRRRADQHHRLGAWRGVGTYPGPI